MEKIGMAVQIVSGLVVAAGLVIRMAGDFKILFGKYSFIKRILTDKIKRSKISERISLNLLETIEFNKMTGIYCEKFEKRQTLEWLYKRVNHLFNWNQISYAYYFFEFDGKNRIISVRKSSFDDVVQSLWGWSLSLIFVILLTANMLLLFLK
jgi:hypothetical protein